MGDASNVVLSAAVYTLSWLLLAVAYTVFKPFYLVQMLQRLIGDMQRATHSAGQKARNNDQHTGWSSCLNTGFMRLHSAR
jgi:hypothetical protein